MSDEDCFLPFDLLDRNAQTPSHLLAGEALLTPNFAQTVQGPVRRRWAAGR